MTDTQLIRCSHCGATNRVPQDKLAQGLAPKCGQCKQPLALSSGGPLTVTDASFATDVERSPLPVLVEGNIARAVRGERIGTLVTKHQSPDSRNGAQP